jgi:hypothetical protein
LSKIGVAVGAEEFEAATATAAKMKASKILSIVIWKDYPSVPEA